MSKYTSGPWTKVPQNGSGPIIAHEFDTGKQMHPRGLRLICHVLARGSSADEDAANASLIAAAPDLLEALKRLSRLYDGIYVNMSDDEMAMSREAWAEADAAIAKAEGQS